MSVNNNRKCAKCGRTRAEDMSVTYHRFPNPGKVNITKAHAWAKYCWPNDDWSSREPLYSLHITNKVLCGRHFHSSQFYDNERKKLSKFAVPELTETPNDKTNVFNELRVTSVLSVNMAPTGQQCHTKSMKYLNQTEAAALDQDLFNDYKFSVDQLMELAGLSVATAVAKVFPPTSHMSALIVCGPGNNGGDGLVAARHMVLFGYCVSVYYPKRTPKPLYDNLLHQCTKFGVTVMDELPPPNDLKNNFQVLVDALFGFSFKPPVRDELKPALDALIESDLPVCSVDIPSGWHVETGPISEKYLKPELLISLSAPKLCAKPEILQNAKHYLGGRFLPKGIIDKYNLSLPPYPGLEQVVKLSC